MRHYIGIGFGVIWRLDVLTVVSSTRELDRNTPSLLSLVVKEGRDWSVVRVIGGVVDVREVIVPATGECFV